MADDPKLIPENVLPPIYSDAHVIQTRGAVTTVYFLRVPPTFSDAERAARDAAFPGELHCPTVGTITMASELAVKLATSIYRLAGKTLPEE
jgi:hypothetical protein